MKNRGLKDGGEGANLGSQILGLNLEGANTLTPPPKDLKGGTTLRPQSCWMGCRRPQRKRHNLEGLTDVAMKPEARRRGRNADILEGGGASLASETSEEHGKRLPHPSQHRRDLNHFLWEDFFRQWHLVPTLTHIKTVWPILGGLGRAQLTDRRTGKGGSEGKVLTGAPVQRACYLAKTVGGLKMTAKTLEDLEDTAGDTWGLDEVANKVEELGGDQGHLGSQSLSATPNLFLFPTLRSEWLPSLPTTRA